MAKEHCAILGFRGSSSLIKGDSPKVQNGITGSVLTQNVIIIIIIIIIS